jgi:hypothetical protein
VYSSGALVYRSASCFVIYVMFWFAWRSWLLGRLSDFAMRVWNGLHFVFVYPWEHAECEDGLNELRLESRIWEVSNAQDD